MQKHALVWVRNLPSAPAKVGRFSVFFTIAHTSGPPVQPDKQKRRNKACSTTHHTCRNFNVGWGEVWRRSALCAVMNASFFTKNEDFSSFAGPAWVRCAMAAMLGSVLGSCDHAESSWAKRSLYDIPPTAMCERNSAQDQVISLASNDGAE